MPENLFAPIYEKDLYQYRALGVVKGKYYPSAEDFNLGTLVTNSAVIKAFITSKPNRPAKITPDMIENELLFSVYPKTRKDSDGAVILEILKPNKANLDIDSYFSVRGDLVAINDLDFLVRIHHNWSPNKFSYLGIKGTLPYADIKKFWDMECVLSGQCLQLVKGQVVGESPIVRNPEPDQLTPEKLAPYSPKLVDTQVAEQPFVEIIELPNANPQKVTTVKSEITLKFNEIPTADPAPNKKVKLILADENENRFIVLLNSKSYKKAAESVASYARYAGNISGKLGKLTPDGFEVLDAGIKVFELKSNPVNDAESKTIQESE